MLLRDIVPGIETQILAITVVTSLGGFAFHGRRLDVGNEQRENFQRSDSPERGDLAGLDGRPFVHRNLSLDEPLRPLFLRLQPNGCNIFNGCVGKPLRLISIGSIGCPL